MEGGEDDEAEEITNSKAKRRKAAEEPTRQ